MALKQKLQEWYGEGFFLYGAFSSGLTSLWIVQNIIRDNWNKNVPLYVIALIFVTLFSFTCYLIDKLGFIEARANAVAKRNRYMRKLDGADSSKKD